MARNSIAGSTEGKSKSAKYYQGNIKARLKKNAYNTKYHKSDDRIEYRSLPNTVNLKSIINAINHG